MGAIASSATNATLRSLNSSAKSINVKGDGCAYDFVFDCYLRNCDLQFGKIEKYCKQKFFLSIW